jgi:hypothetical protein
MNRFCDGITRRQWLKAGLLGGVGLSLADLLRLEAASPVKGKNAIFIFLDGGQSTWIPGTPSQTAARQPVSSSPSPRT